MRKRINIKKLINIKNLNLLFVFQHYWEKSEVMGITTRVFREQRLGIFFKKSKIVAEFKKENEKIIPKLKNNFVFGIDLLLIKGWISFDFGGKYFKSNLYKK